MDPVQFYFDQDAPKKLKELLEDVYNKGIPIEIWYNGVKVAIAVHPEEFDLLNRLVKES